MHNQDTTKDDFLETMLEIVELIKERYRKIREDALKAKNITEEKTEKPEEKSEVIGQSNDDINIIRFQKIMKEIIQETDKDEIKIIAQTFHDNPIESMKMLQPLFSDQQIAVAKELITLSKETSKMLEDVRGNINPTDPKALEYLSTLNHLNINENRKMELAQSVLDNIRPLENNELEVNNLYSENEAKTLLMSHFDKHEHKNLYDFSETVYDKETNIYKMQFIEKGSSNKLSVKGIGLEANLNTGNGSEIAWTKNLNGVESSNIKGLHLKDLKLMKEQNELEINNEMKEQNELEINNEMKNEKQKSRPSQIEMDGPER